MIVDREEFAAIDNLEVGPHPRDLQIDYTSPTFSIHRRSSFATSSMATTTVGVRPVCGGRRSTPMCLREVHVPGDGGQQRRRLERARRNADVLHRSGGNYQTTWFRAVAAVSFVALLWAAHRYRMRQVQHAFALTLDARVGERTRIARELHDTLLQSFHGLLLRFQTASCLLPERGRGKKTGWCD